MIIPGHMNFFRIEECGLYRQGSAAATTLGPNETFDLIYEWVKGRPMEDTIPWDPESTKTGTPKCYCHDFYKCDETGDYFFVLWKSDSDNAGTIWGAQAKAQTGSSTVVEYTDNYTGRKVIWGRPCYYWIIPTLNTVVSIKVDHSVCDSGLFQEWVTKCITNRVSHENKIKTQTDGGYTRFEFSDKDGPSGRYTYRFDVHLRTLETGHAQLGELASSVTHIIRRDTIKLSAGTDERPGWVKMFDKIPLLPAKPKAKTRQIEIRAEAKPSATEIKKIIEQFAMEDRKANPWNNVGFVTERGSVVWVDKYRLHSSINFNKDQSTVFAASEMHARLMEMRDRILTTVQTDERSRKRVKKAAAGKGS